MNEENSSPTCVICMFLENFRGLLIDDIGVVTIYAAGLLSTAPASAQPRLCMKHGEDVLAQIGRARAAALMREGRSTHDDVAERIRQKLSEPVLYCNACGRAIAVKRSMGREFRTCSLECVREMNWRQTLSIMGKAYQLSPEVLTRTEAQLHLEKGRRVMDRTNWPDGEEGGVFSEIYQERLRQELLKVRGGPVTGICCQGNGAPDQQRKRSPLPGFLVEIWEKEGRPLRFGFNEDGSPSATNPFIEVREEGKFLKTCADDMPNVERLAVLAEEFGEVARHVTEQLIHPSRLDEAKLRKELVEVAAVCVAWAGTLKVSSAEKCP